MSKISYKFSFIFIYFVVVTISFFILFFIIDNNKLTNIHEVSSNKFYEEFDVKNKKIENFIDMYKNSLSSLSHNKLFLDYVKNNKNEAYVNDLFKSYIKVLSDVFQIRYLDNKGNERIRVEKLLNENLSEIIIQPKERLQNKAANSYFQRFIQLNEEQIGLSFINLNKEFGKVDKNKTITLRIASTVFSKENKKEGVLILNIDLKNFFDRLKNSSLYDIMLIDNQGKFLLHYEDRRGIRTASFHSFTIYNEFGKNAAKKLLNNSAFINDDIFSKHVYLSNEEQNVKLILKTKFNELVDEQRDNEILIYVFIIFLVLLFLPVTLYFSRKPESLRNQINLQNITDPITKLPNREFLINDLKSSYYNDCILVLINIDNYQKIQNIYGYKIADKIVVKCSIFLKNYVKKSNTFRLYKLSKNQFGLLFRPMQFEYLKDTLKQLQNEIENNYVDFELLISIATSSNKLNKKGLEKLQEASIALEICHSKKLDICIYDENLSKDIDLNKKNLNMVKTIRHALKNDEVIIQFQPIYNNIKNKIDKYETLVRIKKDDKLIYPGEFINIAKDIKKYKDLTKIVIDKSFEYFKDKNYEFSINLTLEDINDKEITSHLFKQIQNFDVNEKLVIEIVESEAIENMDEFMEFLKAVKSYGCKVAIDDFGSGYSNYEYIMKLSEYIDYVKLDGSLIKTVHKDPKVHVLVGSIKFICDTLQIKLIAEYVENLELFEYVKSMGIDYSQGYYIGKSKDEIED